MRSKVLMGALALLVIISGAYYYWRLYPHQALTPGTQRLMTPETALQKDLVSITPQFIDDNVLSPQLQHIQDDAELARYGTPISTDSGQSFQLIAVGRRYVVMQTFYPTDRGSGYEIFDSVTNQVVSYSGGWDFHTDRAGISIGSRDISLYLLDQPAEISLTGSQLAQNDSYDQFCDVYSGSMGGGLINSDYTHTNDSLTIAVWDCSQATTTPPDSGGNMSVVGVQKLKEMTLPLPQ